MLQSSGKRKRKLKVSEFYLGKSVFITGASGFVGTVLLETMLRCCLGIKSIFMLLRPKDNMTPELRKEKIFNKKIFDRIKEENMELLDKVHVIAGDISLENLGMSEENMHLLTEEVSIVFHCAAITHLKKPLKFVLVHNVLSVNTIIEMCRQMKRFEVLVYTSTAYSNCNRRSFTIEEEFYRLPFRAERFLNALKNDEDKKIQELFALCKPDWPNTYTFSKCLAENVIMDTASDLPIAVIRPSLVFSTWKNPMSGYDEGRSAIVAFLIGVGKGFVKVILGDPCCKLDLVPADIVSNAHIIAAWSIGTKRCQSPIIVHCTASENLIVTLSEFNSNAIQLTRTFPLPQSFKEPTNCIIMPHKYLFYIVATYHHYLPAIVLDGILKMFGKKSRTFSLCLCFDRMMNSCSFFRFHSFNFEKNNLEYLDKLIHPEDRKDLTLDFKDTTLLEISLKIPEVSPFYSCDIDEQTPSERQKNKYWCHMIFNCIQAVFIITFCLLLFWIFSLIFL